jgi:hypothetical protein
VLPPVVDGVAQTLSWVAAQALVSLGDSPHSGKEPAVHQAAGFFQLHELRLLLNAATRRQGSGGPRLAQNPL